MLPSQLKPEDFTAYPPEGKQLATARIALLQQLPLAFLPLLLREVIAYDWKFPTEREDLDHQLAYLESLSREERRRALEGFETVRLSPELEHLNWVNFPQLYSERLTAHLWATHQIDAFRQASTDYVQRAEAARPPGRPLPLARLGLVVIGQGVSESKYPLFRKLRPHGVYFRQVKPDNGVRILAEAVAARAAAHPVPFGHWYVDGGDEVPIPGSGLARVSYKSLETVRIALLKKMEKAIQSGIGGPEALRTMIAALRPEDVNLTGTPGEAALNHFRVSIFTEGSGTQIFSTTFVQWAAREVLRRAQPLTLLVRFAPRQRERPMNELLSGRQPSGELDPQGSLVDADMGAYYTWLNLQRLPGAEQSSFLVWFEDHQVAVAIGPTLPRDTESNSPTDLQGLLDQLG
jgi:hypothetical protein